MQTLPELESAYSAVRQLDIGLQQMAKDLLLDVAEVAREQMAVNRDMTDPEYQANTVAMLKERDKGQFKFIQVAFLELKEKLKAQHGV